VLREFDPNAGEAEVQHMTPARRRAVVTRLAYRVMNEINRVTAVTPGALVATALLTHDKRGVAHADLLASCTRIASTLRAFGARLSPSLAHATERGAIRTGAVLEALDLFARAGNVEIHHPGSTASTERGTTRALSEDSIYVVPPEARLSLDLSKNVVCHFFVSRAMVATALLALSAQREREPNSRAVPIDALRERVLALSKLFKHEFQFRADAPFDQIFDEEIEEMVKAGDLALSEAGVTAASARGKEQIELYASVVRSFVEGYRVAARGLTSLLKGPLSPKDVAKRALPIGERMFLAGEVERREAVSRPVLENAYLAFVDQGYLTRTDGKLALTESFASATAVRTIEGRIAGFLQRAGARASEQEVAED
jgi:glycerol-3-phosphate O-acyltransferase